MAIYQIKEYGRLRSVLDFRDFEQTDKDRIIPSKSFDAIWDYILEFQSRDVSVEKAFKLFTKGGKRVIQAQNYVGLIETSSKDTVEILPKIFSDEEELSLNESKSIFLKMIGTLKNSPFINVQQASLDVRKNFPILEIFIKNFITELETLILRGIKRGYSRIEENSNYLKGQLLFSKNLLKNITNGSRFYISYSKYIDDIPQNRIIKSCLIKLMKVSSSSQNRSSITHLLLAFHNVTLPKSVETDLKLSEVKSRLFNEYERILTWSQIFLNDKSFITFSGSNINQALLFPMEKLFESYIAALFKKHANRHFVHSQHNKFYLVNKHIVSSRFRLKPDLYIEGDSLDAQCFVIDTKWKIIDESLTSKNYLISQSDMYQLYAYGRKYIRNNKEPKLILIYPMSSLFKKKLAPFYYETTNGTDHLELTALPFDLKKNHLNQIENIMQYVGDLTN